MDKAVTYTIVEARRTHILPVAVAIEAEDGPVAQMMGMTVRRALRATLGMSSYRRAAILADRPVALWGAVGSLLDDDAEVWLVLTPAARARPFAVVREAVNELGMMLGSRRVLRSSLLCDNARALRFAQFLGFKVDETAQVAGAPLFLATLGRT